MAYADVTTVEINILDTFSVMFIIIIILTHN